MTWCGGAGPPRGVCSEAWRDDELAVQHALQPRRAELQSVYRGPLLAVLRPFFGGVAVRWQGGATQALRRASHRDSTPIAAERDRKRRGPVGWATAFLRAPLARTWPTTG